MIYPFIDFYTSELVKRFINHGNSLYRFETHFKFTHSESNDKKHLKTVLRRIPFKESIGNIYGIEIMEAVSEKEDEIYSKNAFLASAMDSTKSFQIFTRYCILSNADRVKQKT